MLVFIFTRIGNIYTDNIIFSILVNIKQKQIYLMFDRDIK